MKTCDDFEMDLDRRARGALGPGEAAALDAHLAGCERCRAYAALAAGVDAGLRAAAGEANRAVQWESIERVVDARARELRRARWLVPVTLFGAAAIAFALGVPPRGAALMAAGALVTSLLARALEARWQRDRAQAERDAGGLVAFARRQVDEDLRGGRRAIAALVAIAAAQVSVVELVGRATPGARLAVGGGAALLVATAVKLALVDLPRLRRQRKELA